MERILADIDADHGDRDIEFLRHGLLLVFGAPGQLTADGAGARPDHPISGHCDHRTYGFCFPLPSLTFRQWLRDLAGAIYEQLSQWTERSTFQGDDPSRIRISAILTGNNLSDKCLPKRSIDTGSIVTKRPVASR